MTEQELAEFIASLPAHLRFFFEKPPPGLEAEELLKYSRERLEKVRLHLDELLAHGIPADQFLHSLEEMVCDLEAKHADVERTEDTFLAATADKADAEYKLFCAARQVLGELLEANPFDPKVQEMRDHLEEWAKHFPKE